MARTEEQFDALVKRLEHFAQQQPGLYRLQVGLLAGLGYVYVFFILAVVLASIGLVGLVVVASHHLNAALIKLAIVLLIVAGVIVRSLWVSIPPPEGLKLTRQQVPRLFALVDELTDQLAAPQFHHILLDRDFNASVIQVPRLGIFGWHRNYLTVGLPLMQALSLEQFRAVLAHELGHLSGNHSRFAGWIYRVRKTWMQIFERLHGMSQGHSSWLFERFFNWYAPFFGAYSFVLARMNEYEADRCAMQLAGADHMAAALIAVEIKGRFLQESFWDDIYGQVAKQADPPAVAFSQMRTALRESCPDGESHQWLSQALARPTDTADTHPCLRDRLKALGYDAPLLEPAQTLPMPAAMFTSAADLLLGDFSDQVAREFDQIWQAEVSTTWRQRFAHLQALSQQLDALEQKARLEPLTIAETWQKITWVMELQDASSAIPLMRELLTTDPTHPEANYTLGSLLLKQDDLAGVALVEAAIAQCPEWGVEGYQLLENFFWQRGQTEPAQTYRQKAVEEYKILVLAQQERSHVKDGDRFKPHTFTAEEAETLIQQLATYPEIRVAYLVEKVVAHFPQRRFCVLGVERRKGFVESEKAANNLLDKLARELTLPSQGYIVILNHSNVGRLKKTIPQVERSLLYRRP